MDYSSDELMELAYEILAADNETAEMIKDTLNDYQLNLVLSFIESLEKKWSSQNASR